jgi:STE24 endopeptidase
MNIGWLLPNGTEDCGSWSYFWLDVVLALMFEVELIVLYSLFFLVLISVEVFYVQERYGFRRMALKTFLVNKGVV